MSGFAQLDYLPPYEESKDCNRNLSWWQRLWGVDRHKWEPMGIWTDFDDSSPQPNGMIFYGGNYEHERCSICGLQRQGDAV